MNRRRFTACAVASVGWLASRSTFAGDKSQEDHPLGIILNTVKKEMMANYQGTLRLLAEMGYRHLEGPHFGSSAKEYKRLANEIGLETICGGSSLQGLHDNYDKWLKQAEALKYRFIVCYYPWLFGNDQINVKESYQTADRLNDLGRRLKASGVSFAWHPHAWEYKADPDGQTPIDVIMQNTDPDWVSLEMDIYWTVKAGADPAGYMNKYPGRTQLLHVKDMTDDPEGTIACVGDGTINYETILKQAAADGIPYWFVENETDQSDIECARRSADHLKSIM